MTVTAEERLVGSTGKVTCSNGYFLMGNDSITCLEDGVWSPIKAICNTCVLFNISSLCLKLIYENRFTHKLKNVVQTSANKTPIGFLFLKQHSGFYRFVR